MPRLLNEYVVLPSELDAAFERWLKGYRYTFEDNPQSNILTPQLSSFNQLQTCQCTM